jgi:hypothetical protein
MLLLRPLDEYDLSPEEFLSAVLEINISSLPIWGHNAGKFNQWSGGAAQGIIKDILNRDEFFSEVKSFEEIYDFLIQDKERLEEKYLEGIRDHYLNVLGEAPSDSVSNSKEEMWGGIREEKSRKRVIEEYTEVFGKSPPESLVEDVQAMKTLIAEEKSRKRVIEEYTEVFGKSPSGSLVEDVPAMKTLIAEEKARKVEEEARKVEEEKRKIRIAKEKEDKAKEKKELEAKIRKKERSDYNESVERIGEQKKQIKAKARKKRRIGNSRGNRR